MLDTNKIRRIVKAQQGLHLPPLLGNPYMYSTGIPTEGIVDERMQRFQQQQLGQLNTISDAVTGQKNPEKAASQILAGKAQVVNGQFQKQPLLSSQQLGNLGGIVGKGADFLSGFIQKDYDGKYGAIQQGGDQLFNSASNVVMGINPIAGGIMKAGGLVSDVLTKYAGMGTDNMTTTDAILGSKFLSLTPMGMINGLFGKKTQDFHADKYTIEQVGGSYGGSVRNIANAQEDANKKYGLFSGGARRRANRRIDEARRQQNIMADIAEEATDRAALGANMSDLNSLRYGFDLNGGYDQRYLRAARSGAKLNRVKKIEFHKVGGEINSNIEWQPVITEAPWQPTITSYKEGGEINSNIEWQPVITLQDGGQVEKWDFETWFNSIPSEYRAPQYDYQMAFNVLDKELLKNHAKDPNQFHLPSVSGKEDKDGRIPFLKLGKRDENKEVNMEFTEFYEHDRGKDFRNKYDVIYDKDRYYYVPKKFKDGGELPKKESELEETNQKNIIPEGALHARKHNMENSDNLTKKGIPVVDNDGEQQAEIEKDELIMTLEVTKKLEELYSKYTSDESSQKEKDEVAIEAGKLLVYQILENTEDRTGLISTLQQGGTLELRESVSSIIKDNTKEVHDESK